MRHRHHVQVTAASLLAACSAAVGIDQQSLPHAGQQLAQTYPGVHAFFDQGKVTTFAGVPMTVGMTPRDAATGWLQAHGEAFGVGALSVETLWETPVMNGRFTAFGYRQTIAGLPVEFGNVRILVLNEPVPRVVYAAATVAATPADVAAKPLVSEDIATQLAKAQFSAKGMDTWHRPERIVWQGNGTWTTPVTAWKVMGYASDPARELARTYIINCTTGRVEFERNEVYHTDVSGTVRAMATPGSASDNVSNPPVMMTVGEIKTTITGGGFAYTNRSGAYTIAHPGVTPVTVNSGVGVTQGFGGLWVNVVPTGATPVQASTTNVTPPGPGDILLNALPAEGLTAQVNTLIHTNITHNYIKDRAPGFNGLDIVITANTGVSGTCNANFQPGNLTINFFNSGGGCNNTAFSSVINHEYGHFIVNRLGLAQGGFGEGYGDVCSILILDDPIVGRGFRQTSPDFVRDPIASNVQYPCVGPCGTGVHCCGQLLGASWWRIRQNMGAQHGSATGLNMTRDRHVAWSMITIGGTSSSAMSGTNGQTTAIEILTVDDDDGNLNNGTPNRSSICNALAQGSVICPALSLLSFSYPNGRPASFVPSQPTQIAVNVSGVSSTPQPGTGTVSYRVNGGSFTTISMAQGSPNQYTATIPGQSCGSVVDYYFSALAQGGGSQTDPVDAPATVFSATANSGATFTTVVDLNFNTDPGWTRTPNGGTLSTGQWDRGVPVSATGQPTADFDGSGQCWVTDNRTGNNDVDGGPNYLTTGIYDLSAYAGAEVSFGKWQYSVNGVPDSMTFEYSTNGGTTWSTLRSFPNFAGWQLVTVPLPSLSSQSRFRWNSPDQPNDSVTESAIDAFKITVYTCSTPQACYANCDSSTGAPVLTANDFQCFLNKFAAGDSYANCDGSTGTPTLTSNDFQCFLNKFAAGCS